MASVNKVILIGNVGRDPEARYAPSGGAICNLSLATTRSWKDKASGEKREETEWHRVVFYDRLAEIVVEYAKKGRALYVEGRLKTRKWQDKDGVEKYTTEIVAEEMQLLGSRDGGGGGFDGGHSRESAQGAGGRASTVRKSSPGKPHEKTDDDDIPFAPTPARGFENMDDDIPF